MTETVPIYPEGPLNAALGRGTIYTALGVFVLVGLTVTVVLGFQGVGGPGVFSDRSAWTVGGLAIIVLSVALLVLTFSLTGTIRYIQREMADLTRLRKRIEESYGRLAGATERLGGEVQDLRGVLEEARRAPANPRGPSSGNGRA